MPYTSPAAVVSGAVISKSTFADVVKADLDFLANPPACRVFHSTTQSFTDNTEATVAFDSERYDTDSMHNTVTNNSRITINTAGLYLVTFSGNFAAAVDMADAFADLRINGSTYIARGSSVGAYTPGGFVRVSVTTTYKFAVTDYVEVRAFQDNTSGAARNLLATGNASPEFAATWIGLG